MRYLAFAICGLSLVACSFDGNTSPASSGDSTNYVGGDNGESTQKVDATVDPTYTALFDADATVPTQTGLVGLWQSVDLGTLGTDAMTIRLRFTETELLIAVRYADATFGVTTPYQVGTQDATLVRVVVARDVSATGHDGGNRIVAVSTKSGPQTARYTDKYDGRGVEQHQLALSALYTLVPDNSNSSNSYVTVDETAGFQKIGD